MKFVELADAVRREGGISGGKITTCQADRVGELERVVNWVRDAWRDIQTMYTNWQFLYHEASHPIPQYTGVIYPPEFAARQVADWGACSFRIARSGHGRHRSDPILPEHYQTFRDHMMDPPNRYGRPDRLAIHPRGESIHLTPAADQEYELFYDYWRVPQELVEDDDEPVMPDRFHMLIVWEALQRYGGYEVAPDVIDRASARSQQLLSALIHDQLPRMSTDSLRSGWYGW